jgi:hypothetical protein
MSNLKKWEKISITLGIERNEIIPNLNKNKLNTCIFIKALIFGVSLITIDFGFFLEYLFLYLNCISFHPYYLV